MDTIYKTFAEVLLLHEFYYTDSEGKTIFDIPQQIDKKNYLLNNYDETDHRITDDMSFEPAALSQSLLASQRMRLLPGYSGFKIATEVKQITLADGSIVYQPPAPLSDDFNINILLVRKTNSLDALSNSRVAREIPSVYYFSNENVSGNKTWPSLSNNIQAYDPSVSYEMGELSFKDAAIKQFISDGSADPWVSVTDNGYINETDRLVVPFTFIYSFSNTDNVNQASFTLKDAGGAVFKTIDANSSEPLQQVNLDLRKMLPDLSMVYPTTISQSAMPPLYTLEVTGNNSYSKKFRLLFFEDAVKLKSCWGIVNIKTRVNTASFNLIDDNGYLTTKISGTGVRTDALTFEIRVKSRLAYWWYLSNNSQYKLKTSTDTQDFVNNAAGILKSKKPKTTTFTPTLFTTDGVNFKNLPNPDHGALLLQSSGQFYKNILVGRSAMFPVDPV